MSKIFYKHGVMGSGKTLDLLRVAFNYKERGLKPLLFKPDIDTRDGVENCIIKTRAGLNEKAFWFNKTIMIQLVESEKPDVIIVDESQFFSKNEIDFFQKLCYTYNIPIIMYGLKNNFKGELFEGSKRILEIADKVEEFKTMCHCGNVARQNARVVNGVMATDGETVSIGGNEMYTSLCNHCFINKRVEGDSNE